MLISCYYLHCKESQTSGRHKTRTYKKRCMFPGAGQNDTCTRENTLKVIATADLQHECNKREKKKDSNISLIQKRACAFTGKIFYFPKLRANATLKQLTKLITPSAHTTLQVHVEVPAALCAPSYAVVLCALSVHISAPLSLLQTLTKALVTTREKQFCKNIK